MIIHVVFLRNKRQTVLHTVVRLESLFLPLISHSWQPKTLTCITVSTCVTDFGFFLLGVEHQTFRM